MTDYHKEELFNCDETALFTR